MIQATLQAKNLPRGTYTLQLGRYRVDQSPAIILIDAGGLPAMKATVCLVGQHLTPDEGCVFIKDYSENEGIFDALCKAGILTDTMMVVNVRSHDGYARQGKINETLRHAFDGIPVWPA